MLLDGLIALFLLLCGALAGVLIAVECAVVPMLVALPGDVYVTVHRLLDPGFDPLMPRTNKVTLAIGVTLTIVLDGAGARLLVATAVACVIGVAVVSETLNVRINRRMDGWDPGRLPAEWHRSRVRWALANRVRTAFAVVGFAAAVGAAVLAWA